MKRQQFINHQNHNTMKKALLFIGLALCSTVAFAQANNYAKAQKVKINDEVQSINLKEVALEKADYKASIFTKAEGDTLGWFYFNTNTDMTGVIYGADGLVSASDVVNNVNLTPNGSTDPSARWRWIEDTNYFATPAFVQTYPRMADTSDDGSNWMVSWLNYYLGADGGGFMLMSLTDVALPMPNTTSARNQVIPHAYFQLPAVPNTDLVNNKVVDVAFTQIHWKFYDQTFIDYKIGNNWKTREINVDGVDADVNKRSYIRARYVMPIELGAEQNINIRFRYLAGVISNAWGYIWAVDNVFIISGGVNRWTADAQDYAGGAYGTIPQGMEIPLSWWAPVYNAGYNAVTGAHLTATHIAPNGTDSVFADVDMPNLAAGDPTAATAYYFNEQGLLYTDSLKNNFYYFVYAPGAYTGGHYMDSVIRSDVGYRSIPTQNLGRNRVAVAATADNDLSLRWDTIAYRVVGNTNSVQQPVAGYRWGHDNGIIPAGDSYQYGYHVVDGTTYLSETGSWDQNGYGVYVRYTTGATIPLDEDQRPWVLRGVEIVTSPEFTAQQLNGAKMRPVTYVDMYDVDEGSIYFYNLTNGVDRVSYTMNGNDINNTNSTGVGQAIGDNYQAVNIFFPEQPELWPNTSYRVGYQLTSSCTFAAATTRSSYLYSGNSFYSYDSNEISAPWKYQFTPNCMDVLVADPLSSSGGLMIASCYHNSYPMIRAIVGPREDLEPAYVNVICEDENAHYIQYSGETVCGNTVEVPETSGPTFTIMPAGDNMVLDSLFIDGAYVPLNSFDDDGDDDFVAYDYSILDTVHNWWNSGRDSVVVNLERYYWTYTFRDIHGTHSISATSHYQEWTPTGVDPVAPEVRMTLAPNPATSQVALNIKGVSGMVNCSVIDMSGRTVYDRQINAENANTIDLRSVPAGAYFVRITNDTFSKVEKLIVH